MSANGYAVTNMLVSVKPAGAATAIDIECGVMGVVWNTGDTVVQWETACPDGYGAGVVKGKQNLDINYALDYDKTKTPMPFALILDEYHGEVAKVTWTPDPNVPAYILSGDVILQRGTRTHNIGAVAASTVNLPCLGAGILPPVATP